jgi:hypothetical protein
MTQIETGFDMRCCPSCFLDEPAYLLTGVTYEPGIWDVKYGCRSTKGKSEAIYDSIDYKAGVENGDLNHAQTLAPVAAS